MKKKGLAMNMMAYLLLALAAMAIVLFGYLIMSGKLSGSINFIKNAFKFGV
jgi:hypothetical protein